MGVLIEDPEHLTRMKNQQALNAITRTKIEVIPAFLRRKLGSESVKTQYSKIYFSQIYFLMAMNSHTCLSGASHADMDLTGYISHRACVSWACISEVHN